MSRQMEFKAGDILLFKLSSFDEDNSYHNFAHMAAYVQSFPYSAPAGPGGPFVKPWPHLGVATSSTHVAQFEPNGQIGMWDVTFTNNELKDDRDATFDILRPRDVGVAARLAAASEGMVGTDYAQSALLGFAAASHARMMLGTSRNRAMQFAHGIERVAWEQPGSTSKGHTCVSAVIAALRQAGTTVNPHEPGVFMPQPNHDGFPPELAPDLISIVDRLTDQVYNTFRMFGLTPGTLSDSGEIQFFDEATAQDIALFPGNWNQKTSMYLNSMVVLLDKILANSSARAIMEAGTQPLQNPTGWLVSPAMLVESLQTHGFDLLQGT